MFGASSRTRIRKYVVAKPMIPAALSNNSENDYCKHNAFETDHVKNTSWNWCSFSEFPPLACNQLGHCMENQPLLCNLLSKFLKRVPLQAKINAVSEHLPHLQWGRIYWKLKDVSARIHTYSIFSEDSRLDGWSINSTFVLCFTRIEGTPGYQKWCRGRV